MIRKHRCPDCYDGAVFEDWSTYHWANDPRRPYVVGARHIHTGRFKPCAAFKSESEANAYCSRMREFCTSHEHFSVFNNLH